MAVENEFTAAIDAYKYVPISLSFLLSIVASATRELCAQYPQHNCQNGATNDWEVGKLVRRKLEALANERAGYSRRA